MKYIEPLPEPRCGADIHLSIGETLAIACALWVLACVCAVV